MITKTKKTILQQKCIQFSEYRYLIDENGEIFDIYKELKMAFDTTPFDLTASYTEKENIDTKDFEEDI